jgi:AmmeMemoRadiSam system protein A
MVPPALESRRRAFVTLRRGQELRGCVGSLAPQQPLHQLVAELAVAAALRDSRFPAVTADELPLLTVEISVLTPPGRVNPDAIVPGRHGVCVIRGDHRAVLLPQIAVEYGWDRETFLATACRKAGLDANAWREPETIVLRFCAQAFDEEGFSRGGSE